MPSPSDVRLCFFGDSFVNGVLDGTFQGWPGRLCADLGTQAHAITLYNLGVRRDTSEHVEARWLAEARARIPEGTDGRLVFSFGVNDCALEQGRVRVASSRSVQAATRILSAARAWLPVLWVGPPAISAASQNNSNARIAALSASYAESAARLDVPYLDLHSTLRDEPEWLSAIARGDGAHPDADGYTLLARTVSQWEAWASWWRVEQEAPASEHLARLRRGPGERAD